MMKKTLAIATLAAVVAATAFAGYLQHVAVDVADSRQNFPLRVARGEVVDLSVDFFDEGEPIDFEAGASATLHTRTNSMDAAYSWQTSGSVSSNAVLFVLDVDAVLPAASGEWTVVVEGGGRVLARAGGQAYVRGGAAASVAADPVPALSGYATTNWTAAAIESAVAAIDVEESDPVFAAWVETNDIPAIRLGNFGVRTPDSPEHVLRARMNPHLKIEAQGWTNYFPNSDAVAGKLIEHQRLATQDATNLAKHAAMAIRDQVEHGWTSEWSVASDAPEGERLDLLVEWRAGEWGFRGEIGGYERFWFTGVADIDATFLEKLVSDPATGLPGHTYTATRHFVQGLDGYATTGQVAQAVAAIDIPDPDLSFTNDFARTESLANLKGEIEDGWWSEWRYNSHSDPYTPQQGRTLRYLGNNTWSFGRYVDGTWVSDDTIAAPENATSIYFLDQYGDGVTATRRRVAAPVPTKADDIGAQPAGDYATPTDVATEVTAASNALARAWSADSVLLSSMLLGSNVVAEVTNYNSQVRSPTLRLLQLNESNEYFQVWAETNNLSRVALAATNHADAVSAAAYVAATNFAAPRAWSGTTSGLGADAPEGWTWISTPNLAIGGGLEFEKHVTGGGEIWVLKNNGMVAQFNALTNNAAYLEIASLDGESVFRIEKTDSVLLGVDTTSVSVDGNTLVCGVAAVSAEHPLARVRASLTQGDWTREEDGTQSGSATILPGLATVEWSGQSGAWVCRITNNTGGHSLFATMAYLQEGGTKIVPAAPMDASAGILCTDGVHKVRPVYNNGAISWEVFQ